MTLPQPRADRRPIDFTNWPDPNNPTPCAGRGALFNSTHPGAGLQAVAICNNICTQKTECEQLRELDAKSGGMPTGTWAGVFYGPKGQRISNDGADAA